MWTPSREAVAAVQETATRACSVGCWARGWYRPLQYSGFCEIDAHLCHEVYMPFPSHEWG